MDGGPGQGMERGREGGCGPWPGGGRREGGGGRPEGGVREGSRRVGRNRGRWREKEGTKEMSPERYKKGQKRMLRGKTDRKRRTGGKGR